MNKFLLFIKKNYLWFVALICLFIVFSLVADVFGRDIIELDVFAHKLFVDTIRSDSLTILMRVITGFGSAMVLIILSFCSLFIFKNKKKPICITCNLIFIALLNWLIKYIVQRARPIGYALIIEQGYSFPSGHAMISMAFYGYLIYLAYSFIKNKKIKWLFCISLSVLIILIGSSRIYLGIHYASDVISGTLISIIYLIIYIKITNRFILNKNKDAK